jgi:hypothetical protein
MSTIGFALCLGCLESAQIMAQFGVVVPGLSLRPGT